jgi:hypothetical protein
VKILVAGSRDIVVPSWKLQYELETIVAFMGVPYPADIEIVTGGARGADASGARWAEEMRFESTVMNADWGKYGKRAGYIRNKQMADYGLDCALIFWDGESRGTKMMIDLLEERSIDYVIVTDY